MKHKVYGRRTPVLFAFLTAWLVLGSTTNAQALKRIQKIALEGPEGKLDHQSLDSKRNRLFVANTPNSSLDVVDLKTGKLLKQIPGQKGIQGIAYAPDLDRVFVGNGDGGICNVFDGQDYKLLKSLPLGEDADNVRYDPHSKLVYVAHADEELSVVVAEDFTLHAPIKISKPLGAFQLERSRRRLFANAKKEGLVVVIDTDQNKIVGRLPVTLASNNSALAVDETNDRVFVGCRKPPALVVLNSDTGKELASLPLGGDVDDMYYDSKRKRIYASCGEGFLVIIDQKDANHYEVLGKKPTAKLARTSFFDPVGDRLFLVVPRQRDTAAPEVWIYQPQP